MSWRPLSLQGKADPRFDETSEGLPPWLVRPVTVWVYGHLSVPDMEGGLRTSPKLIQTVELSLRLEPPSKGLNDDERLDDLCARIASDGEFGLDVVHWMLVHAARLHYGKLEARRAAEAIEDILRDGGSPWEVTPDGASTS